MPSVNLFNTCEECVSKKMGKFLRAYRKAGFTVIEVNEKKCSRELGLHPMKRCKHPPSDRKYKPTVISITARRP